MNVPKRCMGAFATSRPLVALASRSRLFDPSQSLSSELFLINYLDAKQYTAISTELRFCSLQWCETSSRLFLVAGHESGAISVYEYDAGSETGLKLLVTRTCLSGDVTALACFVSENPVLVAGSSAGELLFWTLTNLSSEYKFENPLAGRVNCLACNQVYRKFLAVGLDGGQVVVLDLKKKAQVLRLSSNDFREPRRASWDAQDPTVLHVMSEREFLTSFNLKLDTVTRTGAGHRGSLLAFRGRGDVLVSSGLVTINSARVRISEATDCAISARDPVLVLSKTDGTTEIAALPLLRRAIGMCRIRDRLLYGRNVAEFRFSAKIAADKSCSSSGEWNNESAGTAAPESRPDPKRKKIDEFCSRLVELVERKAEAQEVIDFLLEPTRMEAKEEQDTRPSVVDGGNTARDDKGDMLDADLKDPVTLGLLRGDYGPLRETDLKTRLCFFAPLLANEGRVPAGVADCRELLALARLTGDYASLSRLRCPRVRAAALLACNSKDFSSLKDSDEARIIHGALSRDPSEYFTGRVGMSESHTAALKIVPLALAEAQRVAGSSSVDISSPYASEYFWLCVSQGEMDKVSKIAISDPKVAYYLRSVNSTGNAAISLEAAQKATSGIASTGTVSAMSHSFQHSPSLPPHTPTMSQRQAVYGGNQSHASSGASPLNGARSFAAPSSFTSTQRQKTPSPAAVPQQQRSYGYGVAPRSPQATSSAPFAAAPTPAPAPPSNASVKLPFRVADGMSSMSLRGVPQVRASIPSPSSTVSAAPSPGYSTGNRSFASAPVIPSSPLPVSPSAPSNVGANSFGASQASIATGTDDVLHSQSIPSSSTVVLPTPPGAPQAHKIPAPGSVSSRGFPHPSPASAAINSGGASVNASHRSSPLSPASRFAPPPVSPKMPFRAPQFASSTSTRAEALDLSGSGGMHQRASSASISTASVPQASANYAAARPEVVEKFNAVVRMLIEKSEAVKSILTKPKRAQCIRVLSLYEALDKSTLPAGVLDVMEAFAARLEEPDAAMKHDIDAIVSREPSCTWLKAAAELVRIVY